MVVRAIASCRNPRNFPSFSLIMLGHGEILSPVSFPEFLTEFPARPVLGTFIAVNDYQVYISSSIWRHECGKIIIVVANVDNAKGCVCVQPGFYFHIYMVTFTEVLRKYPTEL